MPRRFETKKAILPTAQQEIWPQLASAQRASFVLYGGTAIALHLGHRTSVDFDFFSAEPLDKARLQSSLAFMPGAQILQDGPDTLVVMAKTPSGPVKLSFFGNLKIGRVNEPLQTADSVLLVASLDDLMATKLKTILDRAEARDYRDIAAMISAGVSLERGLAAFSKMFGSDPALPLRAIGYFKDGDLPSLPKADQDILRAARDRVTEIPDIELKSGLLSI